MTVSPVQSDEVEQWGDTGLEDMNMSDAVMPRIKILGKEGLWTDNLTDSRASSLYFISLGLVKQRVLFHPRVEEGDVPMCKSSDFKLGYPNPETKKDKPFPWAAAGLAPADFPADETGQQGPIGCDGCQLKDWGSHPTGGTPYCAEQWTMPIYFDSSGQPALNDPEIAWDSNLAEWMPAILTLQKSSLKAIKAYLSSFKASNKPPFLNVCKGTLKVIQRGEVMYSVPAFNKGPESPRERWNEFAQQFGEMKTFLTRPPIREDDEAAPADTPTDNTWNQPVAEQAAPEPVQPFQPEVPAPPAPPPAQPVTPAAPAPPPAAPAPPPAAPAPPPAQPVTPTPAPPAAPAPEPAPEPTPQSTPVAPPAPAGQGLPF